MRDVAPWPCFTDEEIRAVSEVLASNRVNYWTGTKTRDFERAFAEWAGASQAVALTNGTLALDVALRALGIGAGDEVVVTPRTFMASASCVVNAGATPIFADVDRESGNISAATIEPVLTSRTRAIIPVHLGGWPCDMTAIMALADARGIAVIEDCAQAHGAAHAGRPIGSFGQVAAWSFCQDKIMTTGGEGGMVTTNDSGLWSKMWSFKDHGKSWEAVYEREHPPGFRWLHETFGTNWRMLEMQAVIGLIQLQRMPEWNRRRTAIAHAWADAAKGHDAVRVPEVPAGDTHAYYRQYFYVRPDALAAGWSRDRMVAELADRKVPAMQGSCSEVYLEKAFRDAGLGPAQRLSGAVQLGETSIALLTHPTMEEDDVTAMCERLSDVLREATR